MVNLYTKNQPLYVPHLKKKLSKMMVAVTFLIATDNYTQNLVFLFCFNYEQNLIA